MTLHSTGMHALPFRLKVPGDDIIQGADIISRSFTFHGMLRFDGAILRLEWAGSAAVDEVTLLDVSSRVLPLPTEHLELSMGYLRHAEYRGGWLRPRLELAAWEVDLLRIVPGEAGGVVRLWLTRGDREQGRAVAAALTAALRAPGVTDRTPHFEFPPVTPPEGV
jgi:hypothetical protein